MHIDFLTSLFKDPESEPEPEFIEEEEEEDLAYVKVTMKPNMSLEIESWWNEDPEFKELAFAFGTLLKFLTNGGYDTLIATDLHNIIQHGDETTEDFVNQVMKTWKEGLNFKDMQEKLAALPVISPLKTFGESNFGG